MKEIDSNYRRNDDDVKTNNNYYSTLSIASTCINYL